MYGYHLIGNGYSDLQDCKTGLQHSEMCVSVCILIGVVLSVQEVQNPKEPLVGIETEGNSIVLPIEIFSTSGPGELDTVTPTAVVAILLHPGQ